MKIETINGPTSFTCYHSDAPDIPVLLSVPHAGRDYPSVLLDNLRVPAAELIRLEDRYADRLIQPAIGAGFPAIVAHRARAWIDLNRAESDLDAGMFAGPNAECAASPSIKARGGLGLFPRRLQSCGELWRTPMLQSDAEVRIEQLHRPYHQRISHTLAAMRDRFGIAILIDVHSMPPLSGALANDAPPKIVVGDRFGRSAASIFAELAMRQSAAKGLKAALNSPYSGDYTLQAHGNPALGIHALQLEFDRSLYLDADLREPTHQLKSIAAIVTDIAAEICEYALGRTFAQAAE